MHDALTVHEELRSLRDPILLSAFRGWNDPTGSATATLRYLRDQWGAREVAELDPDWFYDFTVHRPFTRMIDEERTVRWPSGRFYIAQPEGAERDFVLLSGREPSLRWRTFTEVVEEVMRAVGATASLTLGARPAAVPHTRPAMASLSNAHEYFEECLGLTSRTTTYQGPTGITAVLSVHLRSLGWRTGQLSALVPHYVAGPNPKAILSLIETLDRGFGTSTPTGPLADRVREFEAQADEAIRQSDGPDEAWKYVRQLEEQYDSNAPAGQTGDAGGPLGGAGGSDLPSSDDLLRDLDDFLRERRET